VCLPIPPHGQMIPCIIQLQISRLSLFVRSLLDAEVRNRLDGLLFSPLSVDSQSK